MPSGRGGVHVVGGAAIFLFDSCVELKAWLYLMSFLCWALFDLFV